MDPKSVPSREAPSLGFSRFDDAYLHYAEKVWRWLIRLGIPERDAEDALQEVFMIAYSKWSDFEGRSKVDTWLYAICFRLASVSRRSARRRYEQLESSSSSFDALPSKDDAPNKLLENKEAQFLLQHILDEMPLSQRAVFTLFELEEMSTSEIAELLQIPKGTVFSRLRLAREFFQKKTLEIQRKLDAEGGNTSETPLTQREKP